MIRSSLAVLASASCLVSVMACGSSVGDAGGSGSDGGGQHDAAPVCTTFAAPLQEKLPRVEVSASRTGPVVLAIDALLAAQEPPVAAPSGAYSLPTLGCDDLWVPTTIDGYGCSFTLETGHGAVERIDVLAPSMLAQNLFEALKAAGSSDCNDFAHGDFIHLENVSVSEGSMSFDDGSNYSLPPSPNLVATGSDALAVVEAFSHAKIVDCEATRKLFVECSTVDGESDAPSCGYQWDNLSKVGSSELNYTCEPQLPDGGDLVSQGGTLDAADSLAVWGSVLHAAKSAGFKPTSGTIEQTTVINASYFSWDGTKLGLTLVTGNATPPPPTPTPTPEAPQG